MKDRKAPQASPTADPASETWNQLPWKKLEKHTFRIQKRIYRASQRGNVRAVHTLQKLLTKSEAARLIAVRRVTQENQGKKTAGVDGVKSVAPKQRFELVKRIHPNDWKQSASPPARRVWIPKPGKTEQRPLGIPTMLIRAQQALGKMALEPEWEARFEPNSYGFRERLGHVRMPSKPSSTPFDTNRNLCSMPTYRDVSITSTIQLCLPSSTPTLP